MSTDVSKLIEEIRRKLDECERLYKSLRELAKIVAEEELTPAGVARTIIQQIFGTFKEEKPKYIEEDEEPSGNS